MAQFRIEHPWDPNYALPPNVIAEPPGRGTLTSVGLPRKTFDDPVPGWDGGYNNQPAYIRAEPIGRGAASTMQMMRRSFSQYIPHELGDDASDGRNSEGLRALKAFGDQAADIVMSEVAKVPKAKRAKVLEALLERIDVELVSRVTTYIKAGMTPHTALSRGIQDGFGKEIMRRGRAVGPADLSGFWDSIKDAGKWILTKPSLAYQIGSRYGDDIAKAAGKVGGLACKVANSSYGPAIGGAVTTVYGGNPAIGVAGVQAGANLCPKGQVPYIPEPPPMFPSWVLPAAIGGVGLVAVILLTRKPTP